VRVIIEKQRVLKRKGDRPDWIFRWDGDGYIYRGKKHTYRLFFEGLHSYKPVWIGMLIINDKNSAWVTMEKEIRAESIELEGCKIVFE